MKSSSGYQLENPMHKVMQAFEQVNSNTSFLTNANTYIMKKLTSISPFLLLLVPVFIMMVLTLSSKGSNVNENEASIRSTSHIEFLKVAGQLVK